jgi:undecaprenyl-diphosphatase
MWAIAGAISLAMAVQGSADWIQSVDDQAYRFVVENEVGVLVWFGQFLGTVGSLVVIGPVMVGVAVFLWVKHRWSALTIWVSAIAVSQLVSITMKSLYGRPRPPLPLMETSSFSFPSGHAITSAVFAVGLILVAVRPGLRRPWHWALVVAYILAIAWSRVYVRAHWLSDVTAGVAIGTAVVLTAVLLVTWLDEEKPVGEGVDDR